MTEDALQRLKAALSDRYAIERELGSGGMATVYLAHDVKHERKVAVKVLRPELAAVLGAERFVQEIKTTASLQHPHILPLFDSGEAGGFLFYVMPYIEGETVRDKLNRETQLGIEEAVRIATEVAGALDYAHRQGVIHRDIKPENILLHDGRPMVMDFGIALAVSAAAGGRMTETGLSLGTPHYMSPEQATADKDLTARSDVYSLGSVLYEMLTGEPPHMGTSAQQIIMKIVTEEAAPVTKLRKSVPPNVAAAVAQALEKLPADRFASAQAFAAALTDRTFTRPAAPAFAAQSSGTWRRVSMSLAGLSLGLLGVAVWGWSRSPEAGSGPVVRAAIEIGDRVLGNPGEVIISPDGTMLAMLAQQSDDEWGLFVRRTDEEEFHLLTDQGAPFGLTFSPDGKWIAYQDYDDYGVKKVRVDGGPVQTLVPGTRRRNLNPYWGADGHILLGGDSLYRIPESGGMPELIWAGETESPQVLPGGGILFRDAWGAGALRYLRSDADSAVVAVPDVAGGQYLDVDGGYVIYVDVSGTLWGMPFDARKGGTTGPAVLLEEGVSVSSIRERVSVSRTGTLVYARGLSLADVGKMELLLVSLSGEETVVPLEPRRFGALRWSPEGDLLAFTAASPGTRDFAIFVYAPSLGTAPRQVTSGQRATQLSWSPDASRIAFGDTPDAAGPSELRVIHVRGDTSAQTVLRRTASALFAMDWTRDDRLVFNVWDEDKGSLWMMNPSDSGSASVYLETERSLGASLTSPQGDLIAYQSGPRVFVRSFPDPGPAVAVSPGRGGDPRWSPDGDLIYFWKSAYTQPGATPVPDSLFRARVRRTPQLSVEAPQFMLSGYYGGWSWDLHPDGDRFAALRAVDQGGEAPVPRYFIVTNWFNELRAAFEVNRDGS